MQNRFVILGFVTLILATPAVCRAADPVATPKNLLETILNLSKANEYETLKSYVVPVHVGELKQEEIVVEAIKGNNENSSGDYAYSDLGLEMVLNKHGDAFKPELSDFWKKELGGVIKHSPELKKIAWDQYRILEEGPIHIVVVKIDESYKLVFWENVNQLLKESRGTAPTKASEDRD